MTGGEYRTTADWSAGRLVFFKCFTCIALYSNSDNTYLHLHSLSFLQTVNRCHGDNMRRNLARVGRLIYAFIMCYSLLILRDQLSQTDNTQQDVFDGIMKERISRIEKFCHNKSVSANIKTGDNLYVLPHKKILWCPVFKAASTNWMYNLLPLAGLDKDSINVIRLIINILSFVSFNQVPKVLHLIKYIISFKLKKCLILEIPTITGIPTWWQERLLLPLPSQI